MSYLSLTDADREQMLAAIGVSSIEELFRDIPEGVRYGRELEIAAMFVDLRGSTSLATDRLPYDALFLFDRYIQAVTGAIRRNKGHATSIAGDGVMSVFGVDGTAALAARNAFQAALDVWSGLEVLSEELAAELEAPLRIGIGIHFGMAVVGLVSTSAGLYQWLTVREVLQFFADLYGVPPATVDRKSVV